MLLPLAFGLLVGVLSASAVQLPPPGTKPVHSTNAPGSAASQPKNLTPAAPVSSQVHAVTEEDIRDIRQPRHLPTPPLWAAVVAGVVALAAGFAVWQWIRRAKSRRLLPHEVALQALEEARHLMDPGHAREYCFVASTIIRRYIEERFRLQAPRLTTEEFLRELVEVRAAMLEPHRALLGNFLEHCDLAKFAGWRYSQPDLEAMHASAKAFVQQTASDAGPQREEVDPEVSDVCGSSTIAPPHASGSRAAVLTSGTGTLPARVGEPPNNFLSPGDGERIQNHGSHNRVSTT